MASQSEKRERGGLLACLLLLVNLRACRARQTGGKRPAWENGENESLEEAIWAGTGRPPARRQPPSEVGGG
jgi:DNA-binding protein H-NS